MSNDRRRFPVGLRTLAALTALLALTWYANRLREQRTGKRIGFLHILATIVKNAKHAASQASTGRATPGE